jgi:subtilase family serine protease
MMLQLRRSPEQEQALQQFINDIHDHASPLFHHWITAEEFGQSYGLAPAEVARVTDWLESQGFKVNLVYPNQMVIDFTGSAG